MNEILFKKLKMVDNPSIKFKILLRCNKTHNFIFYEYKIQDFITTCLSMVDCWSE